MKIAAKTAESFLRAVPKEIAAVLFYGPDQGLVRERAEKLLRSRVPDKSDPFNYAELGEDILKAEPTRLAEEMAALSFTGGQRAVFLRAATDKHAQLITDALASRNPQTLLVLCGDDLSPRSTLRQMFEKDAQLAALPCYHDEAQDVGSLLRAKLEAAKISAPREVVDYVVQQLGNDRMVSASELEKLVLFAGNSGRLSLDDAKAVIAGNRLADSDDLAHAVALGNVAALEPLLRQLQREGMLPVQMLRGVNRYFQRLYAARLEVEEGKRVEEAVAAMRPQVFFRDVPLVSNALRRWNSAALRRAMGFLNEAELATKTQATPPALTTSRVIYKITTSGTAKAA